jgi:hypothetical protein
MSWISVSGSGMSFEYWKDTYEVAQGLAATPPWIVTDLVKRSSQPPMAIVTPRQRPLTPGPRPSGPPMLMLTSPDRLFRLVDPTTGQLAQTIPVMQGRQEVRMDAMQAGKFTLSLRPLAPGHFRVGPSLDVYTLASRWLDVRLHFVTDAAGRTAPNGQSRIDQLKLDWSTQLNQAQLLLSVTVENLRVKENLGDRVMYRQGNGTIFDVLKRYTKPGAHLNVFVVWRYEDRLDPGVEADPQKRIIVLGDNAPPSGKALSKGVGRLFGITRTALFASDRNGLSLAEILKLNDDAHTLIAAHR